MRYFFISDIHGNLPALEKFVSEINKREDIVFMLGDIVNYGPWSNECIELLDTLSNVKYIMGNHEKYFLRQVIPKYYLVKLFTNKCIDGFKYFEKIKKYKNKLSFNSYILKHTIFNKYIFKDTLVNINNNYIIGHSHQQYKININKNTIFNPGSLGQNRKSLSNSDYGVYDIEKDKFILKTNIINSKYIIDKMKINKYPNVCINYYLKMNV